MKKCLIVIILLVLHHNLFAQPIAGLRLVNHNTNCTVYVNVFAIDNNLSDGSGCDIWYQFVLPPSPGAGSTLTFLDPTYMWPYFYYATNPFSSAALYSEIHSVGVDWTWTDATFQYSCTDCGVGGNLWEGFGSASPLCFIHCQTSSGTSWGPPSGPGAVCAPPLVNSATWTSSGNCNVNDVQIDFY